MKNKLQIFLVTYNRQKKLKITLDSVLDSPIADFDITVLDNASTDGTSEMLDEYANKHNNIIHIRHKTNIGGNANICRAFEMAAKCGKEYAWILCDDDKYDFSNWKAVEQAIKQQADLICVADYIFPNQESKTDKAYQIFQMTFVPATVFKTSLITDGVLMNMYDSIYTMFQQTCLTAHVINNDGFVYVLDKPIVFNGWQSEDKTDDASYVRGTSDEKEILERRKNTSWILGFCNAISLLQNKHLKKRCVKIAIPYKDIYGSWNKFYKSIYKDYFSYNQIQYFHEIFLSLPYKKRCQTLLYSFFYFIGLFIKFLFSIHHNSINICGFKIKTAKIKIDDLQLFVITHNRADLLSESIESILNQTVTPKEIIVLDNESTDNTEQVVSKYAKRGVKYVRTTGFLGNYYKARDMAKKEYCMLFHDDDILHPDYLRNVLKVLNREKNVSLITTRYKEFFSDKPKIPNKVNTDYYVFAKQNEFARYMYFVEHIAYATAVYKTKFFKQEDLQYDKYNKFNDWPLMVRMAKYGKTVLFKDEKMFFIRRHAGQDTWTTTNQPDIKQIINWDLCFYEVFKRFNDKKALKMQKIKAVNFLRGKYDNFVSMANKTNTHFADVIKIANAKGLQLSEKVPDFWKDPQCMEYVNVLIRNKKVFFRNLIKNIFSIDHSQDNKYRILRLLGLEIKLHKKSTNK